MTRAQTALWFVKSFGQEVKSIAMKEVKSGSKRKAKMARARLPFKTGKGKSRSHFISFRHILYRRLILS